MSWLLWITCRPHCEQFSVELFSMVAISMKAFGSLFFGLLRLRGFKVRICSWIFLNVIFHCCQHHKQHPKPSIYYYTIYIYFVISVNEHFKDIYIFLPECMNTFVVFVIPKVTNQMRYSTTCYIVNRNINIEVDSSKSTKLMLLCGINRGHQLTEPQ